MRCISSKSSRKARSYTEQAVQCTLNQAKAEVHSRLNFPLERDQNGLLVLLRVSFRHLNEERENPDRKELVVFKRTLMFIYREWKTTGMETVCIALCAK